ncbi:MAG: AI-2E family transporter [Bacteroidota bacterium]
MSLPNKRQQSKSNANVSAHSKLTTLYQLLVVLTIVLSVLYIGRSLLMPMVFAIFLAMLLFPIVEAFKRFLKIDVLAVSMSFIVVLVPIIGITSLIGYQLTNVVEGMNSISAQLDQGFNTIVEWVQQNFGIEIEDPTDLAAESPSTITGWIGNFITGGLISTTNVLINMLLTFIYTFFLLLLRHPIRNFLIYQMRKSRREHGQKVITRVRRVAQQYLVGMLTVMGILAVLNSLGLWLIGVEYAIFWGCLGALLAAIPYIGTIIGGILPLLYTLATTDTLWQPIAVVLLYQTVQAIEGNFITPKVVGSNVQINTLIAVFAMIFWGTLWGVGGIILAIPLTAIVKIMLAQLPHFEPISHLMSESAVKNPEVFREQYDDDRYRVLRYLEKE